MSEELNDQDLVGTPTEEETPNEEQANQEQSDTTPETEQDVNQEEVQQEEPITAEKAYELARVSQKGLTQTFQKIARLEEELRQARQVSGELPRDNTQGEPQTWQEMKEDFVRTIEQREIAKEQARLHQSKALSEQVQNELEELKFSGIIKDEKDQNEVVAYAMKHNMRSLVEAGQRVEELRQARREGMKMSAKAEERQTIAKNVGTSQKTSPENNSQGLSYEELSRRSFFDL